MSNKRTHRVAVNGYVINDGKFLLLKRATPPILWAPPGGRLNLDEDPREGLKREIKEETNLNCEIMACVDTWFGEWNNGPLLSLDYLVKIISGKLRLSDEHTEAKWISINELREKASLFLNSDVGFKLSDFETAWKLYQLLNGW